MQSVGTAGNADTAWTSAGLSREHALREWNRVISAEISGTTISVEPAEPFGVAWRRFDLGPLDLHFYDCGPLRVGRRSRNASEGCFVLVHARRGPIQISHGRGDCVLAQGGLMLLDDDSPYAMRFPQGGECLTARMPERWLRRWVARPQAMLGRPIGAESSWSRPLAETLASISTDGLPGTSAIRTMLADHLGVLTALIADHSTSPPSGRGDGKHDLRHRVLDVLRDRYHDPELSPAMVAQDLGISKGHLHRVMAMSDTSFCSELIKVRILRAGEMLRDERHRDTPIGDIAWLCGFADSSHFSRVFRARSGTNPTHFRSQAQR